MKITENIIGIIKAMTAYGGDCKDYESFWNDENIESFRGWLSRQRKVQGAILYRGYTFDRQYFNDAFFEVGRVVGVNALTQESLPSFTDSIVRASKYINDFGATGLSDTQRVLFIVQTNGRYFVDISAYSYYPEEGEHKCTERVKLKVLNMEQRGSFLEIKMEEV